MRVSFGDFTYDSEVRELLRGGDAVRISRKAFDLLGELLAHRPRARSKQELFEKLWPATFVTEATLASLIRELRQALGDRPRAPRFVRTIHGYGYAFCGSVVGDGVGSGEGESLVFRLQLGRREVSLRQGENYLGRTREAVLWVASPTVSRRHARVVLEGGRAVLEDLGSKNGTFLRGERLTAPAPLEDGDEFEIGSVSIRLRVFRGAEPTATAH